MSSPFDPLDPPEIVLEAPTIPEIRIDPPDSDTFSVVPVPGPPGPPGPPGNIAGQIRATRPAATSLSGHRIVTPLPDGTVTYASNTEPTHQNAPFWLTLGAVSAGADTELLCYGLLDEPSWSWSPGPLYLGEDGLITQTPPTAPSAVFLAQIGFATGATTGYFDRLFSIFLI